MTGFLFSLTNAVVLPFWALMILAPRWRWTLRVVASPLIVLPLLLIYAALVLPQLGELIPALARPTLDGIQELLGTPAGAAAGWAHFLALDLFVGRWIFLDARERAMPARLVSPLLVLVFMFAPIGLLAHLAVRSRWPVPAPVLQDA